MRILFFPKLFFHAILKIDERIFELTAQLSRILRAPHSLPSPLGREKIKGSQKDLWINIGAV